MKIKDLKINIHGGYKEYERIKKIIINEKNYDEMIKELCMILKL